MRKHLLCAAFVVACSVSLSAQNPFATEVVDYQQGTGGGIFVTENILGGPLGAGLDSGSLDVLTLGDGGSIVLGFDVVLRDRPGADLAVFENGFAFGSSVFAELAFVEVSSNGIDFARFPATFAPPSGGSSSAMGSFAGFGGGLPVLANVATDPESPFNPALAGGEALDLFDLSDDPAVLSGAVDLEHVRFVRLVDVLPGELDSVGNPITTGDAGGADFDAVVALHHSRGAQDGPLCDLALDGSGHLILTMGDLDGIEDLDLTTLTFSLELVELPFAALLNFMTVTSFDGSVAELRSLVPVSGAGITTVLGVSVRDLGGTICGDQLMLQG